MKGKTSIIKPLTEYQETGANVSTLQCFFRNLPADGARLVDRIRGIEYTPAGATYDSTTHAVTTTHRTADAVTALDAGTWPAFSATESGLLVAAGRINLLGGDAGPRFAIGDVNTAGRAGWGMAPSPFHSSIGNASSAIRCEAAGLPPVTFTVVGSPVFDSVPTVVMMNGLVQSTSTLIVTLSGGATGTISNLAFNVDNGDYIATGSGATLYATGTVSGVAWAGSVGSYDAAGQNVGTAGLDVILYSKYQPGSVMTFQARNAETGALVLDGSLEKSLTLAADAFSPWAGMRFSGIDLYASTLFKFSGALPADTDLAAWWMGTSWVNNERYIWPGAVAWS